MRKFIVLFVLLFLAGFTATLWAASSVGSGTQSGNVLTQGDQGQVAGQLKGEAETKGAKLKNSSDHKFSGKGKKKGFLKYKGKNRPGNPSVQGKSGTQIDDDITWGNKGKKGKVNAVDDDITWGKNAAKSGKGLHKNENVKNRKNAARNLKEKAQIDDEVTWGKNEMKGKTMQKGKGFLKLHDPADKVGNQVPATK